ncbi:MAG: sigma-54-dependent Fis family transcriptional regulator [Planctomycetota bacterium]|nr:MAG: sigma-54-dependent Fis family transcriptional regulator [Planctomycetota bacterium]
MQPLSVLIVDDEEDILRKMSLFLQEEGCRISTASSAKKALEILQEAKVDIVISDIRMPTMNGLELLSKIKEQYPQTEVILMTGYGNMETVIQALRQGALDFLNKPVKLDQLRAALLRSRRYISTLKENRLLHSRCRQTNPLFVKTLEDIKGKSAAIQKVKDLIRKASEYDDTTILITGESGTGKELVAKAIHFGSSRRDHPFITVNCSAIPENLVESEFFGYRKGAFTGAMENKIGFFEAAHQGSLFLDEIGDMPLNAQMKLLRVLEEKKIKPVGHRFDIPIDVRTIAATNQNLEKMVEKRQFRQDLFYRIDVFRIHLPPLRERREDIPLILDHFVQEFNQTLRKKIQAVHRQVYENLSHYSFPGNIRELRNMVERAMILCPAETLEWRYFQDRLQLSRSPSSQPPSSLNVYEHELYLIRKALEQTNYNRYKAAKLLGISWSTLDRKMKQAGI